MNLLAKVNTRCAQTPALALALALAQIVWLSTIRAQHTYIISIGRSLGIVEANISYSISINADAGEWSHPKSICLMQQQPPQRRTFPKLKPVGVGVGWDGMLWVVSWFSWAPSSGGKCWPKSERKSVTLEWPATTYSTWNDFLSDLRTAKNIKLPQLLCLQSWRRRTVITWHWDAELLRCSNAGQLFSPPLHLSFTSIRVLWRLPKKLTLPAQQVVRPQLERNSKSCHTHVHTHKYI